MRVIRTASTSGVRLLVAVTLLVGLVGTAPAVAAGRATALDDLNVRSGPGTSHAVIGTLRQGQTVTTLGTSKGWTKIDFDRRNAYVSSSYLRTSTAAPVISTPTARAGTVRATTTALNLRKGAGASYAVLKVVARGTRVTLTGRASAGFTEVHVGTAKGWVASQYLAATSGVPAVIGTRVATAALDLRTGPGADATTVGEVKKGTKLSITGATANGRAQVVRAGAARWVTARYLANPPATLPTAPGLPRVTGTRYATTTLDIRSSSGSSYTAIAEVPRGTALSITGVVQNGRMQIVYSKAVRWVTAKYLTTTKPAAPVTGSYAVERGLKPNAVKVHRAARAAFPQITTYYGVRPDSIPDHPSGRALDLMIPAYSSRNGKALGQQVANWARANARALGIQYVIWNQHIWNVQRDKEGWRYMADRGGDSANHKNHVHITVYG